MTDRNHNIVIDELKLLPRLMKLVNLQEQLKMPMGREDTGENAHAKANVGREGEEEEAGLKVNST